MKAIVGLMFLAVYGALASSNDEVRGIPISLPCDGFQNGTWSEMAPMLTARHSLTSSEVDGIIYAIGGMDGDSGDDDDVLNVVEAYYPSKNSWTTVAQMPTARLSLTSSVVDGIIYAIGGSGFDEHGFFGYLKVVEAYDPSTNIWTTVSPMPTARTELASSVVDGIIYAIGGFSNDGYLNVVEAYDPSKNSWATVAPMPTTRALFTSSVVDGIIYAIGGSGYLNVVEAYDASKNSWNSVAPMPTARLSLTSSVVDDIIYAIGGYGVDGYMGYYYGYLKIVEAYDSSTNSWTTVTPMPTASGYLASSEVNSTLYAVGGVGYDGELNLVQAYIPPMCSPTQRQLHYPQ